jgi:hypothetical protein
VREKFGCESLESVRLVLEADGTLIDDEEYLRWLPDNTVFQLLRPGEQWHQHRTSNQRTHPQVSRSDPSNSTPIPRVVCDALNLLEIRQEPPFWKIIDNRGRVTLVLHWDNGPRGDHIHYIEPSRSHVDVMTPGPTPGPGPVPGPTPASMPRSFASEVKIQAVPVAFANEDIITVVSDCGGTVTTLRGGRMETLINNVHHSGHKAGSSPAAGVKDRGNGQKSSSLERSQSEVSASNQATGSTPYRVAATIHVPPQSVQSQTVAAPASAAAASHGHHGADECEFHCGSLHEEGRLIRGAEAATHSSSHSSRIVGNAAQSTVSKGSHVRFRETLDGLKKTGSNGSAATQRKRPTGAQATTASQSQQSARHDSSESEDFEPESNNTVDGEEQETEGNVTTEKMLLLTDQLSTDQRRHLTILDLGVILDRLKAKIIDVERLEREREGPSCYRWMIKATIRGDVLRDLGVLYNGNYYSISEHPGSEAAGFEDDEDREDPV